MKKSTKIVFFMALIAMGNLAVSCQKTPDPTPTPDGPKTIAEWVKEGVEVDMQSHVVEMNIKADGQWIAISDPDDNWLALNSHDLIHSGSQKLLLLIDENRKEVDRKSTVIIEEQNGGKVYEIPVRQNYNFNGEAPTNGSGQAFANNGVGCGVDYDYVLDTKGIAKRNALEDARIANGQMKEDERTQFSPTKVKKNNPIFNVARIERLMESGKLGPQAYVEAEIPYVDLLTQMMDSTVVQDKSLDIKLELGISYGCIEFVAGATYSSKSTEQRQKLDYTIIRNAPIYNVVISEAEVASYAEDAMLEEQKNYEEGLAKIEAKIQSYYKVNGKETLTKVQQKIIDGMYNALDRPTFDGVFAASFGDAYWDLYSAVAEEDQEKINKAMNRFDDSYGPFYISGGDFGGAMTIHAVLDNLSMEGYVQAGGNLDADFAGAFKVSGEFTYSSNGMDLLRKNNARFYIYGGDAIGTSDKLNSILMGEEPTDRDAWSEALQYWVQTMYSNNGSVDGSKAAPISFIVTPLWNLFWDADMRIVAKEWFMAKYADKGIEEYFGIMNGEEITPEDIIHDAQVDLGYVEE